MDDNQSIHLGLAERGKMLALDGQFALALAYYRQAMRMTVAAGDPEIIFRHYLTCTVECLEQMGHYDDVLSYCDRLIAVLGKYSDLDPLSMRELAATHERRGVVLLKAGRRAEAEAALSSAIAFIETEGVHLPLAATLHDWLRRGWHVNARRIDAEQSRHCYFSVRADTVDPSRAVDLDPRLLGDLLTL